MSTRIGHWLADGTPIGTHTVNLGGTGNILEACHAHRIPRLTYISSASAEFVTNFEMASISAYRSIWKMTPRPEAVT